MKNILNIEEAKIKLNDKRLTRSHGANEALNLKKRPMIKSK